MEVGVGEAMKKPKKAKKVCVWKAWIGGSGNKPGFFPGCETTWWSEPVINFFDFCPHCGLPITIKGGGK